MSLEEFEYFMRKEKKVKKYDQYVEGFNLFQQYLQQHNLRLELVNESILSDYLEYIYDDFPNWETYNSSYGNYILRFYLSFAGKEELVSHLDKLKQFYEPKSKEYKKKLMNQPKFVINLEKELNKHLSQDKIDQILDGKDSIKQNSSSKKKSCYMCQVMQKLESELDEKTMQEVLASGLHKRALGSSSVAIKYKKLYQKLGDIDLLLEQMHTDWVKDMAKKFGDNKDAMEFIENNPLYGFWGGVREGNKLYKAKFPFKITEHLKATDDVDRRYHYCHCGWVKETIRNDELEINGDFCYCGAGWSKQLWDTILGVSLETELVETVLNKDEKCLFIFTLPDKVINGIQK